jgi:hypothetical protein
MHAVVTQSIRLNAMNPGGAERCLSVEFFEVPVQTVT